MTCGGNCGGRCGACAAQLLGAMGFGAIPGVCETPSACVAGDCLDYRDACIAEGGIVAKNAQNQIVCQWQGQEIPICFVSTEGPKWWETWQGIAALSGIAVVGGAAVYFVAKKSLASRRRRRRR